MLIWKINQFAVLRNAVHVAQQQLVSHSGMDKAFTATSGSVQTQAGRGTLREGTSRFCQSQCTRGSGAGGATGSALPAQVLLSETARLLAKKRGTVTPKLIPSVKKLLNIKLMHKFLWTLLTFNKQQCPRVPEAWVVGGGRWWRVVVGGSGWWLVVVGGGGW